jgi:predicted nucleic acid-binding Zn finger protein
LLAVGDRVRIRSDGGLAAARQYAGRAGRVTTIALGFDKIRSFVLVGGNREFVTHCAGGCTQDSPTETEDWSCQGKATE